MEKEVKNFQIMDMQPTAPSSANMLFMESDINSFVQIMAAPFRIVDGGMCYCFEGECEFMINSKSYHIDKGTMVTALPGVVIQGLNKSDDFKAVIIGINTNVLKDISVSFAPSLFLYVYEHPCLRITYQQADFLGRIGELIRWKENAEGTPFRKEILEQLVRLGCYEIASLYSFGKPIEDTTYNRQQTLFRKFLFELAKAKGKERSITFFADRLNISPKYLSMVVKECSEYSANKWIDHYTVVQIKNLLAHSDKSVQEVSIEMNFKNPSFFGQYFKRLVGVTPNEFRKSAMKG